MAVFGAPVAHEDDPERAVRAALAIREALAEEGELEVRIGITTGEALVALAARPEAGEGMASGDVVNTAARLQAAASPGSILVDETSYRATERAIAYRSAEPVAAKGKSEPVAVWEAREAKARFGVDVRQLGRTELVGREGELEALVSALERARCRGSSPPASTACRRTRRRCCSPRPYWGRSSGWARPRRSAGSSAGRPRRGCTRSSAGSSCSASGARRSPARSSTPSGTSSFGTSPTGRFRAERGPSYIGWQRAGSSRSAGPRTTPRCSPTTTCALELSRAAELRTDELATAARPVLEEAGDRAFSLNAFAAAGVQTRWTSAALAALRGDFAAAAELFDEIGDREWEALARLCAAEQLVAEGRRAEADDQLRRSLAFWRSVGATRYVRQGEALLAAAS
jgi:class 3 adenylate cyclase